MACRAETRSEGWREVISDLIICDIKMPGVGIYRTLEAIRECSGTAAIRFILVSGSTGREDFRQRMALGADDYLIKPFNSTEVIAAVKSRFARRRIRNWTQFTASKGVTLKISASFQSN
jgi:CheY-like chemotaxis protein